MPQINAPLIFFPRTIKEMISMMEERDLLNFPVQYPYSAKYREYITINKEFVALYLFLNTICRCYM